DLEWIDFLQMGQLTRRHLAFDDHRAGILVDGEGSGGPFFLRRQSGSQRNKRDSDEKNTTAFHERLPFCRERRVRFHFSPTQTTTVSLPANGPCRLPVAT